jgi:hypothetical protein
MTSNLYEFITIASLVTFATFAVGMFRYTIIIFDRRGQEEIRRRQPEWDALAAKIANQNKSTSTDDPV